MQKIERSLPHPPGLLRVLAVAVPVGLAGAGQAAAAVPPSGPEAALAVVEPGEFEVGAASAGAAEQRARRFERRRPNREGRAFRQGGRNRGPNRASAPFGRRAAAELNLTDEQREAMRQAMRESRDNQRDSRREVADARRSFRQAARDSERTGEELRALGEAVGRAQAEAVVQRRADRERIAGILTEEQRQQLEQMRESRDGRFRSGPRARRNWRRN